MSRVFAYCRVSTTDQTTQNQSIEIKAAGFAIEAQRLIEESISGSVAAKERPGFTKLIDRMESGDILVVTKLDRLERMQPGINRAKAAGKQFGKPPVLTMAERAAVMERLAAGINVTELAREFKTTRQTIMRIREAALTSQ